MPRVKRGIMHAKKRRLLHRQVKGFKLGRKKLIKIAKTAATKAGHHAYVGRRLKKRDFRSLWNIKINAGIRPLGLNYSRFIKLLSTKKIALDRKILAEIAEHHPDVLKYLVDDIAPKKRIVSNHKDNPAGNVHK